MGLCVDCGNATHDAQGMDYPNFPWRVEFKSDDEDWTYWVGCATREDAREYVRDMRRIWNRGGRFRIRKAGA